MNDSLVCVDAGLVIKLVIPEVHSERASALWRGWTQEGVVKVAPRLLRYEATSVLRKKAWRGLLSETAAGAALEQLWRFRIELLDPADLHRRALDLATRLEQPAAYDSHYLALAEILDCIFWTADERLYNSTAGYEGRVNWIGRVST